MTTTFQTYHPQVFLINSLRRDWFDVSDFESESSEIDSYLSAPKPHLPPPKIHFEPITNVKTITTWHISPTTTHKIRTVTGFRVPESRAQQERILLHSTFHKFGLEGGNKRGVDEKTTSVGDDIPFHLFPAWRGGERRERLEAGLNLKS